MTELTSKIELCCPICKADLHHERVDDGGQVGRITSSGGYEEISSNSDGYDRVYCSADESHELGNELEARATEIADQNA